MHVFLKWMIASSLAVFMTPAFADNVHGILRVVKGDVQIKSAKTGTAARARIGEKVFPKDVIITGKDARAKIVMVDKNEINVSPDSQIEIQHYEYDPNAGKKDVLLNVIYGKVRSKVEQKYDGKTSKFQIKTPSAVAGVRGTDFLTSYSPASNTSSIVTFEGKVEFGVPGPNGTIANPVFVAPGQQASNTGSAAPSAPAPVPKSELAKIDNDTKSEPPPKMDANEPKQDQRTPAADDKKKDEGNKQPEGDKPAAPPAGDGKKSDGNKGASSGGGTLNGPGGSDKGPDRQPSSAPPVSDTFDPSRDLVGGDKKGGGPVSGPTMPGFPPGPGPGGPMGPPPIPGLAPCDFCQSHVQDGQTKLIIKVNGQ